MKVWVHYVYFSCVCIFICIHIVFQKQSVSPLAPQRHHEVPSEGPPGAQVPHMSWLEASTPDFLSLLDICRWPKKGLIHIPFCLGQLEGVLCFAVKASSWCLHIFSWPFMPPLHKFAWLMIHKFTFDPTIFFLKIIQCLLIGNKKKKRSNMYPAWQLFPSLPVSWSSTFQLIFCFHPHLPVPSSLPPFLLSNSPSCVPPYSCSFLSWQWSFFNSKCKYQCSP